MDDVTLDYAKEHLEELIERAARGETVRIVHPVIGPVRLAAGGETATATDRQLRLTVPRKIGLLQGEIRVPKRLMEPMSEDELADWYGEQS
jgi:antitoxin (DNA-binding transcriptional repressor) of toxin-antitoxin stability system